MYTRIKVIGCCSRTLSTIASGLTLGQYQMGLYMKRKLNYKSSLACVISFFGLIAILTLTITTFISILNREKYEVDFMRFRSEK